MRSFSVTAAALASLTTPALSLIINPSGFSLPTYSLSAGGKAQCIQGFIPVTTSATTEDVLAGEPANQAAVTEIFVQYLTANSNITEVVNGGPTTTSGTYKINAKLCYPIGASSQANYNSLLFLIHGIGYDK